ncbi:MAG: ion channel [Pacificimonas sp.]
MEDASLSTIIALGAAVIFITVVIQAVMVNIAYAWILPLADRGGHRFRRGVQTIVISAVTLWMLVALSIAVAIWASLLMRIDAFADVDTAVYYTAATYTTLGYGDVLLPEEIRNLSGLIAVNGFIMFGLSTAFLIDFVNRFGARYEES